MIDGQTYYEILDLPKDGRTYSGDRISLDKIQQREREIRFHADNEWNMGAEQKAAKLAKVRRAYDVLTNSQERARYDAQLDEYLRNQENTVTTSVTNVGSSEQLQEPTVEEPAVEEPAVEEPVVEEPVVEEPAVEEPVVEEPVVEEPAVEEPAVEEPAVEEPAVEEPAVEEPAVEEPAVEKPAVEKPAVEEPTKEEIIPISEKQKREKAETNRKEMPKILKGILHGAAYVAGGSALGIPGIIITYLALKKLKGKKLKLHKNNNKKISEVQTAESELIEKYNNDINEEINLLLAKPNSNYNLHILKTRYENQVKLLEKRIELKLNEKVSGSRKSLKAKLEIVALNNQLQTAKKRLAEIEEKIAKAEKNGTRRNLVSNALNEELYKTSAEIKEAEKSGKSFGIQKLNVRKERLQKARDFSVKGLKLTRGTLGRIKDFGTRTWDNVRSLRHVFTDSKEIEGYITPVVKEPNQEEQEEKSGKTR